MTPRVHGRREVLGLGVVTLIVGVSGCSSEVVVHLVRHAEKASGEGVDKKDPPLSERGRARAEAFARALTGASISAVFATEYRRTRETVEVIATSRALEVTVVGAGDTPELVRQIRARGGEQVVVAGHSNTVPEIARELGCPEAFELADDAFGDWFVVRASAESSPAATIAERRRFEPPSTA